MDISFASPEIEKLCSEERAMQRKLGASCARKLRARLADLDTVATVRELIAGRPHPLKGDRAGQFALDLQGGKRLVFEPADEPIPYSEDGSIDWSQVTKARIVFIGDYHD
jgi:proteic killer suppression protein